LSVSWKPFDLTLYSIVSQVKLKKKGKMYKGEERVLKFPSSGFENSEVIYKMTNPFPSLQILPPVTCAGDLQVRPGKRDPGQR
jgi:hypothetical protein